MLKSHYERPLEKLSPEVFDYLSVDNFLQDIITSRALKTAFELRLIDYLVEHQRVSLDKLEHVIKIDKPGILILLGLLSSNNVIEKKNNEICLSKQFTSVLQYRDLLEIKLDFSGFVTADFHELFTLLLTNPVSFREHSRLFKLFDYQRCVEHSQENYEWTKHWMKVTTVLTKYESHACMHYHDFSGYKRMLDIGGNSGEYVLQICKAHQNLHATVMDLPLVCEIGVEHVLPEVERERITFIKGDVRKDSIPAGYDLISFKSMLHDWPDEDVKEILSKSSQALEPGGTILIFERTEIQDSNIPISFSTIPILLFFRSYRSPDIYIEYLNSQGFEDVTIQEIELDTPFYIISARKKDA